MNLFSSVVRRRLFGAVFSGIILFSQTPHSVAALTFSLTPDSGMSQQAIDGFTEAAQLWSSVLTDDVTIHLSIGFQALSPGILGQTSCSFTAIDYSVLKNAMNADAISTDDISAYSHLQSGTSYYRLINHTSDNPNGSNSAVPYVDSMDWVGVTTANARALGFSMGDTEDGRIVFSSSFTFDFSHDSITAGQFDFVGIAAHEIGHVLGFASGVDDIDYGGGTNPGSDFSSNTIDLFRFSAESISSGQGYQDYTADTRTKYFSVDGGTTSIAQFSTGVHFGDGHQASHWKDNLGLGLMDPTGSPGEKLSIGENDLRAMDVLGFDRVPEPTSILLLAVAGLTVATRRQRL